MGSSSQDRSPPAGAATRDHSLAPRESDLPPHDAFTVVFQGNLRAYPSNPYHADTPFGRAGTIALGDVVAERDEFEARTEDLLEALTQLARAVDPVEVAGLLATHAPAAWANILEAKATVNAAIRKALSDGSEA